MHKLRMKAPFLAGLLALLLVAVVNKRTADDWTPPDRAAEIQRQRESTPSTPQGAKAGETRIEQGEAKGTSR